MDFEPQIPDVLAMVVAEDVHRSNASGMFSILNTYSTIFAPTFPWTHKILIVYLAFTEGRGKVPMTMRLVDVNQIKPPIFEIDSVQYFSNPTYVVEKAFFQTDVVIPAAGEYRLQLLSSGEILRERRLYVVAGNMNGRAKNH
jgi:hypothetical protein